MEKITREQAMAMVERAMDITELKVELIDGEENNILAAFKDLGESSEWVRESAAALSTLLYTFTLPFFPRLPEDIQAQPFPCEIWHDDADAILRMERGSQSQTG